MIGPQIKKMPNRKICTGCDVLISKEMGGTKVFRKTWIVNYCSHEKLEPYKVVFIKRGIPYTPKWCPVEAKDLKNEKRET